MKKERVFAEKINDFIKKNNLVFGRNYSVGEIFIGFEFKYKNHDTLTDLVIEKKVDILNHLFKEEFEMWEDITFFESEGKRNYHVRIPHKDIAPICYIDKEFKEVFFRG